MGSTSETTLKPIQVIVNRAVRIMCSAPLGRIDINPLSENLEILKVKEIYDLEPGKFMYKKLIIFLSILRTILNM